MTIELPLYYLGVDIGSTTLKVAVVDQSGDILYSDYRRHNTDIRGTATFRVVEPMSTPR